MSALVPAADAGVETHSLKLTLHFCGLAHSQLVRAVNCVQGQPIDVIQRVAAVQGVLRHSTELCQKSLSPSPIHHFLYNRL